MLRKLALSMAAAAVSIALVLGGSVPPASAADYSLPTASFDCSAMRGPSFPTELTYYRLVYRVNGGQWVWSNWLAAYQMHNWEYSNGWQHQQVSIVLTPSNPGDKVERWAYVYRSSYKGWLDLGSCSRGGIVFTAG